jgi:tryptophan-rich sensory protein
VRLTDRLNMAQRIVIVVATAMALAAIGIYLAHRGSAKEGHYLSALPSPGAGPPGWLRLIIWLVLIGIWAVASVVVLRSPRDQSGPHSLGA